MNFQVYIPLKRKTKNERMCRLLLIKSQNEFDLSFYLKTFAELCRTSKEYQGHGWGLTFLNAGHQNKYHSITPIWENDLSSFGSTTFVLAHARSAFRDEGIVIKNNMPFSDNTYTFAFNGELQGVRIKEEGRIGAEKIFNYIKRFDKGDMKLAFERAMSLIPKKARYIRAMNILMTNFDSIFINSLYNEDPDYFAMYRKHEDNKLIICSQPFPQEAGWQKIANNTTEVL